MLKRIVVAMALSLTFLVPGDAPAESRIERCMKLSGTQIADDGTRLMTVLNATGFAWIKGTEDFLAERGEPGWCAMQAVKAYIMALPTKDVSEEVLKFRIRTVSRIFFFENAHSI